jgi:hypothetical protein
MPLKVYLLLVLFLIVSHANAQLSDDFSSSQPASFWNGDLTDYIINSSNQLQLNATVAGTSVLSAPLSLSFSDTLEWQLFIRLNFSPSGSNYSKIYLYSDQPDITQPLNGYYIQFGEALSNDAIELFRQNGSISTSVCRAADGLIASAFSLRLKIVRIPSGIWELWVDYSGGNNFISAASAFDTLVSNNAFFSIASIYTSGNISNFYFDDIYAGKFRKDTVAPVVSGLAVISDSSLSLGFSEPIDQQAIVNHQNYFLDGFLVNPFSIVDSSLTCLLTFYVHFVPGSDNFLIVHGLKDLSGNEMQPCSLQFVYYTVSSGKKGDIIINEIYFEPDDISPLPYEEYAEIYNRSDSAIQLGGWNISDGSSDGTLTDHLLLPGACLVLHPMSSVLFDTSLSMELSSFPGLNNDSGDKLTVKSEDGRIIDEIIFSDELYHDDHKNDGGWSIERIDGNFICPNSENWKASVSDAHGTPGKKNSVDGNFDDHTSPSFLRAYFQDSFNVCIVFSEDVDAASAITASYDLICPDGVTVYPLSICILSNDSISLTFSLPALNGIYTLTASGIYDCPGNSINPMQNISFGLPGIASLGDIVINELLFDPFEGGTDFIEIYNCSAKIIDLKGWTIIEAAFDDTLDVRESSKVSGSTTLILPGQFIAFSRKNNILCKLYNCKDSYALHELSGLPDFNSADGSVLLYDNSGSVMDRFSYSEDMHFSLLTETKGVSLERLSYFKNTDDADNWHSASASSGFATPGIANSQQTEIVSGPGNIFIHPEIFSPDNDGLDDLLTIQYTFDNPGTVLTINVYDAGGIEVKKVLINKSVANEGMISWDGTDENRQIQPPGLYIVVAEGFDLEGNQYAFKKTCIIGRRL